MKINIKEIFRFAVFFHNYDIFDYINEAEHSTKDIETKVISLLEIIMPLMT